MVFLDTNILMHCLTGDSQILLLFEDLLKRKFQYITNAIVVQELLHTIEFTQAKRKSISGDLSKLLTKVKVVDFGDVEIKYPSKLSADNKPLQLHVNDLLNINSAIKKCDYFITFDKALNALGTVERTKIVSPSKFFKLEGD